ncbi:MAG: helix-turn-helix domain-containing protein [Rickettsiales bacterium]|nr:helix-turn-helix domain-containing protein [Rickettsiales bacterium]MCA0254223.1 helix-turn-helix domain-containing protein [Pseudomonadota bacterium]
MSDQYKGDLKGKADNIDKLVSKRLKMRRVMLGLSQQDIGKAVGVSIQQIQKYEKATNRVSSGKLFAIAKYLKVPVTYFYEKSDDNYLCSSAFAEESAKYEAEAKDISVSEKELISLIKAFGEVKNPQSRKKIIELVRAMA